MYDIYSSLSMQNINHNKENFLFFFFLFLKSKVTLLYVNLFILHS